MANKNRIFVIALVMFFLVIMGGLKTEAHAEHWYKWDYSSNEYWMTNNWTWLSMQDLRYLVLPGSHDAGMSETHYCAELSPGLTFTKESHTRTQVLNIAEQLKQGIRFFDLRPAYERDRNRLWMAHASQLIGEYGIVINGGCAGELFDTVMNAVINFAVDHPRELIVLKFGHYWTFEGSPNKWEDPVYKYANYYQFLTDIIFTKIYWFENPTGRLRDHLIGCSSSDCSRELLTKNLRELMANGKNVIMLLERAKDSGFHYPSYGVLDAKDLPIYDEYSDTEYVDRMAEDQIKKLRSFNPSAGLFLLSWTLTQSSDEAMACAAPLFFNGCTSVLEFAQRANDNFERLFLSRWCELIKSGYFLPSIILFDWADADKTRWTQKVHTLYKGIESCP
ncbi:MAG: hypothetical protein JW943_10590 [Deltaproteobacteria bacterium]|nr:hypothetical protein [Deltaproteobacteria bacterium]